LEFISLTTYKEPEMRLLEIIKKPMLSWEVCSWLRLT